jgi:hypothetical protein
VAPENRITYLATDHSRMVIPEVRLTSRDGGEVVFRTADAEQLLAAAGAKAESREMDCIDCHNRPSHVYLSVNEALDRKILEGAIPRELPFVKRQALEAVAGSYPSDAAASTGIAEALTSWYQANQAELVKDRPELLAKAIAGTQAAYAENVFPAMNIGWGTYVNHVGHGPDFDLGCFRCHDDQHVSADGHTISGDCNTCHTLLSEREADPAILKVLRGE